MQESVELLSYWIELDKFNHFKAKRLNSKKNRVGIRGDLSTYLKAVKLLNFEASIAYAEIFLKLKQLNQLKSYYELNSDCILFTVYNLDGIDYHNFTALATEEALKLLSSVRGN